MKNRIILLALIFMMAAAGFTLSTRSLTVSAKAVSAVPQATPEKPLNEEQVRALLDLLKAGLPKLIDDKKAVAAISEKWDAREDLIGKTGSQILRLLFADVGSVVDDKKTLDAIWANWNEPENSGDKEVVASKPTAQKKGELESLTEEQKNDPGAVLGAYFRDMIQMYNDMGEVFEPEKYEAYCLQTMDPKAPCGAAECVGKVRRLSSVHRFGEGDKGTRILLSKGHLNDEYRALERTRKENKHRYFKWEEQKRKLVFPKECLEVSEPKLGEDAAKMEADARNKSSQTPTDIPPGTPIALFEAARAMNGTFNPDAVAAKCPKTNDPNNPCQKYECVKMVYQTFMVFMAINIDQEEQSKEEKGRLRENIDRFNAWKKKNIGENEVLPKECQPSTTLPKP